jgi:hypothetical protein
VRAGPGLRIAVLGYIVRGPIGGLAWHHLQYILGLDDLGHDVLFLEDSGDDGWGLYQPELGQMVDDPSFGLAWTSALFEGVGLPDRWAYYDARSASWLGPAAHGVGDFCRSVDVVLNLSGVNPLRAWASAAQVRILVDTDPVYTQVRHLTDADAMAQARCHDVFFSFGESIGRGASVPDDGLPWQPTRQPVVLDRWRLGPPPARARYTTVMQWDSYAAVEHEAIRYGMKADSFTGLEDLPAMVPVELELAVGSPTAPRERLRQLGWYPTDPLEPTRDAWTFQRYVEASRAEFAIAKHGYVVSKCGWFSERSANYLASGRPVVTQDTAFAAHVPVGRGLHAYATVDQARDAILDIESRYDVHAAAAREIATEYFGHRSVLEGLLDRAVPAPMTSDR